MSKVYVSEYTAMGSSAAQAAKEPCITDQSPITTSGTSAQSAAFNDKTRLVRVHTDGIISIAFGTSPTATTSNKRMASGQTEYFAVGPGEKLAVIDNT